LERQLIRLAKLAAVGRITAEVAHELNNALTTVIGYGQLLQDADVDAQVKEDLRKINEAAKRSQHIVQNLLALAREKGPKKEYIDINQTIETVLALQDYRLKASNIQVMKELNEHLPWIMADQYQLQGVLLNLTNNAQQAMAEMGGGRLTVRTASKGKDAIRITISDTGPRIREVIMDKIFVPFFTTQEGGTGLGLTISRDTVREHGGRIWAESQVGKGTTFFVELPVRKELEASEGEKASRPHILAVDDEEDILDLIVRVLEPDGYQVDSALSGQEALEKLARNDYDLIISEVKMPGLGGKELYEHLKEDNPELAACIIFLNGNVMDPEVNAFLTSVGNVHIAKPFEIEELRKSVREALKA